jgi:hypothetical protein
LNQKEGAVGELVRCTVLGRRPKAEEKPVTPKTESEVASLNTQGRKKKKERIKKETQTCFQ